MSLRLDHVVIHVRELEAAIAGYTSQGFNVQRGGTHADGATHNALIGFADGSYIELIAFLRDAPEHRWWHAAAGGIEGYVDFALLPGSVPEVVAAANARGLAYQGPFDGGRVRPDGERLRWQTGTPPGPDLPFLCGDLTPRSLRVREGDVRLHANGASGVAAVTVAVNDVAASLARYRALLGPQLADSVQTVAMSGTGLSVALLPLGATTLVLLGPGPDARAAADLRQRLSARGQGVIGLALSSTGRAEAVALPTEATFGAAFELIPR